jgi:hypothetical protein
MEYSYGLVSISMSINLDSQRLLKLIRPRFIRKRYCQNRGKPQKIQIRPKLAEFDETHAVTISEIPILSNTSCIECMHVVC